MQDSSPETIQIFDLIIVSRILVPINESKIHVGSGPTELIPHIFWTSIIYFLLMTFPTFVGSL